jgi:hypothetical protein
MSYATWHRFVTPEEMNRVVDMINANWAIIDDHLTKLEKRLTELEKRAEKRRCTNCWQFDEGEHMKRCECFSVPPRSEEVGRSSPPPAPGGSV